MVKFNQYHVVDTKTKVKARISYSLDNHVSGKPVVTLHAKDYSDNLGQIFNEEYENDTDSQTDYFDEGRVRLFENHPLYSAARAAAISAKEAYDARYEKRQERKLAKIAA